jgi:hypothetical protein
MIDLKKTKTSAMLIKADTTVEAITPKESECFSLKELQDYVGGYIEILNLENDYIMVIDEEGLLKKKKLNKHATKLFGAPIVGDVVVCKSQMVD